MLILDEPTAVLTPKETDELLGIMGQLKADGKAIVFISHKLREVKAVSDIITVIRRGKVVGDAPASASTTELAEMMVGRAVSLTLNKEPAQPGEETFTVTDLTVRSATGQRMVDGLSFGIARGEIMAVAGVQGNGQTELTEAILGLQDHVSGSIRLEGRELVGRSVKDIVEAGVGFVPEDRSVEGLVGTFSVAENLILNRYDQPPFARGLAMKPGRDCQRTPKSTSPSSTSGRSRRKRQRARFPAGTSRRW